MTFKRVLKKIYEYLVMTVAAFLNAVSMRIFINPNHLVPGGFSGIASLLNYVTGINVSYLYFGLNIPLLILALIFVKGDFTLKTIWATVVSFVTLEFLPHSLEFHDSKLIAVVLGGALVGTSMYLAVEENGSNGGTEIIAKMVNQKRPEYDLASIMMNFNIVVLTVGSLVLVAFRGESIWIPFYSFIYMICGTKVMHILSLGLDRPQRFVIITKNFRQMQHAITQKYKRGATMLETVDCEFNPSEYKLLTVICQFRQMQGMKKLIRKYDSTAFVYIKEINEILGRPSFNRRYKYDKDTKISL